MKNTFSLFILLAALVISCHPKTDAATHDRNMTTTLIRQLIQDEALLDLNATLEYPNSNVIFDQEFVNLFKDQLQIKDTAHLNSQIQWFKAFKMTPEIIGHNNLISKNDYETFIELTHKSSQNETSYIDWLEQKQCQYGFSSISKPIFNKAYDLALVNFKKICGPLCGQNIMAIYKLQANRWQQKSILNHSVH